MVKPPEQVWGIASLVFRLASRTRDAPSNLRRNPARVALGRGRGLSRGVVACALALFWGTLLSAAAAAPKIVLFLGDSLTAGYGIDPSHAFPAQIQAKIDAKRWNIKVINAGQSGDTSAGGLNRLDWLLKNHVDILVLELGANDGLRGLPVEVTRKNLQAIIDRTKQRYPQVKIVIAGMQVPPNMGRDYGTRFEALFPALAKKNRAVLISFILEGVAGVRGLNLPDGIHPTAEGHRIIAGNIWKILEPLISLLAARA
jgi:acyl-CoA thioesterase I